jgi:hypothetical protein
MGAAAGKMPAFFRTVSQRGANPMRAYVMTTGAVFGLITVAHLLRIMAEGPHLVRDPVYSLLTVLAAALCVWAWRVLRLTPRT